MPFRSAFVSLSCSSVIVALTLAACVGEEAMPGPAPAQEAGTDTGVVADGGDAGTPPDAGPRTCDDGDPFGDLVPVPGVNTAQDELAGTLSSDERRIYFAAYKGRGPVPADGSDYDLYWSERADRTAAFPAAQKLQGFDTTQLESDPFESADGRYLFFTRRPMVDDAVQAADVYFATKGAQFFEGLKALPGVNTPANDGHASLPADGAVWFVSAVDVAGGSQNEIFRARFDPASGTASGKVLSAGLASDFDEAYPTLTADALRIYFASKRPVPPATAPDGRYRVWTATRKSVSDDFDPPTLVARLSSDTADTRPHWISPDSCRIYVARTPGPVGGSDVLVAERQPR